MMKCIGPISGTVKDVCRAIDPLNQAVTITFVLQQPRSATCPREAQDNSIRCRVEEPWSSTCSALVTGDELSIEGFFAEPNTGSITSPYTVVVDKNSKSHITIMKKVSQTISQESVLEGLAVPDLQPPPWSLSLNTYRTLGAAYYDALFGCKTTSHTTVREERFVTFFMRQFKDRRKVLDAGCGTGILAFLLRHYDVAPTCFDISTELLNECHLKNRTFSAADGKEPLKFLHADIRNFDLCVQFEAVLCIDVLNFLPSPDDMRKAIRGLNRHTQPTGLLIFSVRNPAGCKAKWSSPTQEYSQIRMQADNRRLGSGFSVADGVADVITRRFICDHTLVTEWQGFCMHRKGGQQYYGNFSETVRELLVDLGQLEALLVEEGYRVLASYGSLEGDEFDMKYGENVVYVCTKPIVM